MAKFVYVYVGGQPAETPEAQEASMQAWGSWLGSLGDAVIDMGSPFGAAATVGSSGATSEGGASHIGGYSIVTADSIDDASANAKGCPVLTTGGSVEVYETVEM